MFFTLERWRALCRRIGAVDNPNTGRSVIDTYKELVNAYTGGRFYHNTDHIDEGLWAIDQIRHLAKDPDAIEAAWWFHDFIYDTTKNDNEQRSAGKAITILGELRPHNTPAKLYFELKVRDLVLATRHREIPDDPDARLIVDIDLLSLGAPPRVFERNTANIRLEYLCSVPDDKVFAQGRADFFRRFMANRSSVYLTEHFRDKFEAQAQKNIKRTIDILST